MSRIARIVLGLGVAILQTGSLAGQDGWIIHPVISEVGKPAIELDHHGIPNIVYMLESGFGFAGIATWNPDTESFDTERIVDGYFFGPAALAFDADNRAHINYHDHDTGDQQHVFFDGQAWINEAIEDPSHDGWDNSIAIDRSGTIHTSSIDPGSGGVEYARSTLSGWFVQSVGSNKFTYGMSTSIALDPSDFPHIAYYDRTTASLMLASGTRDWVIQEVVSKGDSGRFASLKIDRAGGFHIAFLTVLDGGAGLIEYAYSDGGSWQFSTIDRIDELVYATASHLIELDLDNDGNPHVAYSDKKTVRYAFLSNGRWHTEIVVDERGSDTELGQLTGLALDTAGVAHLTYYDVTGSGFSIGEIYYARREVAAPVGVERDLPDVLSQGRMQVYPNPSTSQVRVTYRWDMTGPAEAAVIAYDVRGRRLGELDRTTIQRGSYDRVLPVAAFAGRRLILRLEVDGVPVDSRLLTTTKTD